MWISHAEIASIIKNSWAERTFCTPMYSMQTKLKRLKADLKHWNYHSFGMIHRRVKDALTYVQQLETTQGASCIEFCDARDMYGDELRREVVLLRSNSRQTWLKHGDRDSSFFSVCIRDNRNKN